MDITVDTVSSGKSGSEVSEAGISWPASSYTATLGEAFTSPVLTNPNSLTITYKSSNTDVATIDDDGEVTLVAVGSTTISAVFAGTSQYTAATVTYTLIVNEDSVDKEDVEISWPENEYSAVLDEAFESPVLNNPSGVAVTYTSSEENVATVDEDGTVLLVGAGRTYITALFAGDDTRNSSSDTYTLIVTRPASGEDDGAGTFYLSSSDTETSEDNVGNTEFERTITVTYSTSGATVTGDYYGFVSVSGNQVTVNNTGDEKVIYELSGTASDGFFKLYSTRKQAIVLNNLNLTCTSGAAINNQSKKRTYVVVKGSNTLSDASSASYATTGSEDMKAVFFSEGQLVFSGSGSLTVTANNTQSKACITSDDYVRVMSSPTIKVTAGSSAGHGLRGKEYVQLDNGTLNVSVAAAMKKGVSSDSLVCVNGGSTTIKVTGGTAYDSDDAEYKGSAGIKADKQFIMTGGNVTITNSGAGGKGVRAGSYDAETGTSAELPLSYMSGGTLTVTTTGSESNSVSAKGIKIGWKYGDTDSGGRNWRPGGQGGGMPGGGGSSSSAICKGDFDMKGGTIIVNCSGGEGFEVKGDLNVTAGEVWVTSTNDDAINAAGNFTVSGGYVYGCSSKNDALDANGNLVLNGGYTMAICTAGGAEVSLDADESHQLQIGSGATVVTYGSLERGYSSSNTVKTISVTSGQWAALVNSSNKVIAAFKAPSGISTLNVVAPSLSSGLKNVSVSGTTYCNGVWATSGISGGSSVSLGTYTGNNW